MNTPPALRSVIFLVSVAIVALAIGVASGSPAVADDPMRLDDQITDRVDALGDREGEVATALSVLRSQSGLQLFVVYVRSFNGTPAQEWADETAQRSDLGENDGLLAVATGDRAYAYSFTQDFPLTGSQLAEVASIAIEPPLASNDWAGAAVGAAEGYGAALAGRPVPPPRIQPGDSNPGGGMRVAGGIASVGCLLLVLAVAGLIVWLVVRSRKTPARPAPAAATTDPLAGLADGELSGRANSLLVDADDAIKTSDEELAFAVAQYGTEATASFTTAVAAAKQDIGRAFELRQQLDDTTPEDPQTRRAMLAEIIRRCEAADQRLDAEADAFDALRDLEGRLDEMIPQVIADRDAYAGRISSAQSTLDALRARHAESALQSVSDNIEQAQERIQFATNALSRTAAEAQQGNRSAAAVAVRGAQEAVSQAGTLLDAVEKLSADLARVGDAVRAALADLDADIAAGRAMLEARTTPGSAPASSAPVGSAPASSAPASSAPASSAPASSAPASSAELAGEVARAEQVAVAVRAAMAQPRPDPIEALRRLEEVGMGLDRALASVRDTAQQVERARSALNQAITRARAEISAVSDFVATRRAAIGGEARTRLAEAQRHLDRALDLASSDPVAALAEAQQADSLAERAGRLARGDVNQWSTPGGFAGGGGGGVAGAVLGGILLGGILGGGQGGGGFGGGFGGGGWGGRSPGGFGGSSRRGGGGRF
jgi:uncharacterized membrane protein YgcG